MPSGLILPYTDNYAAVLRDESRTVGYADTVSFPRCEEEVCEILRELYAESTPITVQGARTGLAAAAVPFGGHVLNTANMNRVLGMREENGHFYLRVQPGLALLNLRKMIAKKNFDTSGWDTQSLTALELFKASPAHFFPTDPTETTAALGGMAACNASGARSYRYGPMRRHITALRAVLTDGSVIALRRGQYFADGLHFSLPTVDGRAIEGELPTYTMPHTKNASGYYVAPDMDLIDLLIGSDGTLAVMTELELALSVLPAVSWGVTVFLPDEPSACSYAESVREQLNCAAAIEYFDPHALDILREQKKKGGVFARLPDLELAGKGSAVFVELHCDDEAAALAALSQLAGLAESAGGDPVKSYVARTELDSETLGFFRHAVPESVNSLIDERKRVHPSITKLGSDMSVPNGRLMEVTGMYRRTLAEEDLQYASWGHIGDNHIHVNILPRDMDEHARCKALFKRWAKTVTEMGGAVSAEHGVGKLKAPFLTIMYGEEHIRQMRAIKRLFDPGYQLGRNNLFSMEEES